MPLLALDVEGTIITSYDYANSLPGGLFPAVIDPELKAQLRLFSEKEFTIVLATGTDADNLKYYQGEFIKAGIQEYITAYKPNKHDPKDGKESKLQKYQDQYRVEPADIYFFDDGEGNVDRAKAAGFVNSCQITDKQSLTMQLKALADRLGLNQANAEVSAAAGSGAGQTRAAATSYGSTQVGLMPAPASDNPEAPLVGSAGDDGARTCCQLI